MFNVFIDQEFLKLFDDMALIYTNSRPFVLCYNFVFEIVLPFLPRETDESRTRL